MDTLIDRTPDAAAWVDATRSAIAQPSCFGRVVGAVLWTDEVGQNGQLLVDADPGAIVDDVAAGPFRLFAGHDPGFPIGAVIAAKLFRSPTGRTFVAAVVGLYTRDRVLPFEALGIDPTPAAASPSSISAPAEECWLAFAVDSREVEAAWVRDLISGAPLRVEQIELSHNAAEPVAELIRVGLVYVALVWNPVVTAVATEAGKQLYAGIHQWLRKLWDKLEERRNPVVEIQSHQAGCQVSFLFRGKDVKQNYAAHDALAGAAAQAAKLVGSMSRRGVPPASVTYEFEKGDSKWFPSCAILRDGRLVAERAVLIALEQTPTELSLGIRQGPNKPPMLT